MKKQILKSWPIIFIVLMNVIFFGRLFWPEVGIFVTPDFGLSDLMHFNYPMRKIFAESIKAGYLPLWVEKIGMGFPFLAEGQAGIFNIINLFTAYFFPLAVGFNLTYLWSYFLMGSFTYLFGRLIKLSKWSALLAAIVFSFSGANITHFAHIHQIVSVAFLPVAFFALEKALRGEKIGWMVLGIVISQSFLGGNVQVTTYTVLALGLYFLFRIVVIGLKENFDIRGFSLFSMSFGLAVLLSLLLSAVQILPSQELTSVSTRREGASIGEQKLFPYPPKHLLTFLNPYFLGDPHKATYPMYGKDWGLFWENTGYIGLIPLALAAFAVVSALLNVRRFIKALWSRKKVPSVTSAVIPTLVDDRRLTGVWLKGKPILFWSFLALFTLTLSLGKYTPFFVILKLPVLNLFRIPSTFLFVTDFALAILAAYGLDALISKIPRRRLHFFSLSIPPSFYPSILLLFSLLDLWSFGYNYNPIGKASDWEQPPQTALFLQKEQSDYRIWDGLAAIPWNLVFYDRGWEGDAGEYRRFLEGLKTDANLLYEVPSANAYVGLEPERLAHFKVLFDRTALVKDEKIIFLTDQSRALLSSAHVKYFVTPLILSDPQFNLVFETNYESGVNYRVYENTKVLPRAYVVGQYKVIEKIPHIDEYILQGKFDPVNEVVLEEDPKFSPSMEISESDAEIIKSDPTAIMLDVKMKEKGILVLADAYYPGWKARVNGEDWKIVPANLYQRGLILPSGDFKVEFKYEPDLFRIGAAVSGVSWLTALVLVLVWGVKRVRRG